MKLKHLLLGALPLALFAACSSDNVPENREPNIESGDGKYMAVSIKLPTTPSTRAINDDFNDGTANEYQVFNGCLVIFKGADEATATFGAAYDLQTLEPTPDDTETPADNITTSYLKSIQLKNLEYGANDNLYGFVMLNYKRLATVTSDNGLNITGATTLSLTKGTTTFEQAFLQVTSSEYYLGNGSNAYSFFMCNAPLANKPGGSTEPTDVSIQTLAYLEKANIKPTQKEAEASPAGSINVERGVAKATLDWQPKEGFSTGSTVATTDMKAISFSFIGWALDVKESSTYIARNVKNADWWSYTNDNLLPSGTKNYRFIGTNKIGTTSIQDEQNLYRTYWCYDPTYNSDLVYAPIATPTTGTNYLSDENPLYCYENTFNIAHQNYKNTTRAVFQVTLKFDGSDKNATFYVLNKDESKIYTSLTAVESYPRATVINSQVIKEVFDAALKPGQSLGTDEITSIVNITFTRKNDTGIRSIDDITFKSLDEMTDELKAKFNSAPAFSDAQATAKTSLISDANSYVIEEYKDGNSYYDIRFMHFAGTTADADLAPLPSNFTSGNVTNTTEAYGTNSANYLGRYGMVRNNWYHIEVGSVKKLGSPVIPDANVTTSDDNNIKEEHIAFKINVLSWAKRTQKVDF